MEDLPVPYEEFCETTSLRLGEGALRRFATGEDAHWNTENSYVQVWASSNGTMRVTDGVDIATVAFVKGARNNVSPGSIVELSGMHIDGDQMKFTTLNVVLDPARSDCPTIDVDESREVKVVSRAMAVDPSPVSSGVPSAFAQHMASKKRTASTAELTSAHVADKAATVAPIPQPNINCPINGFCHVDITQITDGRDGFVIGPVVLSKIIEGRPTGRGSNLPTRLLFVDATGASIWYLTWSDFASVVAEFGNHEKRCFYVANGVAKSAYTKEVHPCEVTFSLYDGKSSSSDEKRLLRVHSGSRDELTWILQELRRLDKPLSWDKQVRDDPRNNLSVVEALDVSRGGGRPLSDVRISGVVDTVTVKETKKKDTFYSLCLIGKRDADSNVEKLYMSVFSGAVKAMGQIVDLFGPSGYNCRSTAAPVGPVCISGVSITPGRDFPFNTSDSTEVTRTSSVPQSQLEMLSVKSFLDNPVMTLADLQSHPVGTVANCYLLIAYLTEPRPKSFNGRTSEVRMASFMDDSKDTRGNYSTGSLMLFQNSPLLRPLMDATVEQPTASGTGEGTRKVEDPRKVVVCLAMGVTLQASTTSANHSFLSFRGAEFRVVQPYEGDARGEELRKWYIEAGWLSFTVDVTVDKDFAQMGSAYAEMDAKKQVTASSIPEIKTMTQLSDATIQSLGAFM